MYILPQNVHYKSYVITLTVQLIKLFFLTVHTGWDGAESWWTRTQYYATDAASWPRRQRHWRPRRQKRKINHPRLIYTLCLLVNFRTHIKRENPKCIGVICYIIVDFNYKCIDMSAVEEFRRKRPSRTELRKLKRHNSSGPISPMGSAQTITVTKELQDSGNSSGMSSETESKTGRTPEVILPDKP